MRKSIWLFLAVTFWLRPAAASADSSEQILTALEGMKRQMAQMQRTIDEQNRRIQQLETSRSIESPSVAMEPAAAQSQLTEKDWQKGIKDNIGEAIPWLKGAKYGGDFRLRAEMFDFYDKDDSSGPTDRSRNRFRFRLRWGFEKDYGDDWKVGFRLLTGTQTDQTSTNQTLGNPGYFNYKQFNIDRAYAAYEPSGLKDRGIFKGARFGAGKFENPFLRYSTGLVWDPDVTPEGIYEQADIELFSTDRTKVKAQATLGQFIVNENAAVESDAQLYGYQGALNVSTYALGTQDPVDFSAAVSFYDYTNWFQTVLAANNTASTSYLRTNSITADDFRVLNIYPEIAFYVDRTPVTLWFDYAVNTANVGTEDPRSAGNGIHDDDRGWGVGFKIGKLKKKGSWELFYAYYEIGANAVVAAFNDSDFGGPGYAGFTNRMGHKFGLGYQLTDNLALSWTNTFVEPLSPFNGNATLGLQNAADESVWRSQVDALYKF